MKVFWAGGTGHVEVDSGDTTREIIRFSVVPHGFALLDQDDNESRVKALLHRLVSMGRNRQQT